jgi:quercetin dioxygenase-like cupin family protein
VKDSETIIVEGDEFELTLQRYTDELGYRLDMIMPADAPREALLQNANHTVRIVGRPSKNVVAAAPGTDWTIGRAGMMYRDLIPDRLGGKLIASHIRILDGGEVSDTVHYHKIDFQIICCLKGAIRVVYEGQGEPFWLEPGDCVLQPPEIRHRVLEAKAGSEVIEITAPAEHETWFDHEMALPTGHVRSEHIFRTQRFVRHLGTDSEWKAEDASGMATAPTGISSAGARAPQVYSILAKKRTNIIAVSKQSAATVIDLVIDGRGLRVQLQE